MDVDLRKNLMVLIMQLKLVDDRVCIKLFVLIALQFILSGIYI